MLNISEAYSDLKVLHYEQKKRDEQRIKSLLAELKELRRTNNELRDQLHNCKNQ